MPKAIILSVLTVVLLGIAFLINAGFFQRITDIPQQADDQKLNTIEDQEHRPALTTYVSGRTVIWAMDFLPDKRMVFTERQGIVSIVETNGQVKNILNLDVHTTGESGLHGIAVDPDFEDNRFIYLYYTYRASGDSTLNRVSRYIFENEVLGSEKIIIDGIPGASTHDGGRLKFGPDSFLYVTTGDAQEPSLSQDKNSLAGKILRITIDGKPALGNPFRNSIYSYGHRNPQGITWDSEGRLWSTEHGPSGHDELNLIELGANYGWPEITGVDTRANMSSPVIHSDSETWAPAGAIYHDGSIFFAGLRGNALYQYNITTNKLTEHFKNNFGRIRDVVLGPDGFLYIATSNRDGRGIPTTEDDRILKINLLRLSEI